MGDIDCRVNPAHFSYFVLFFGAVLVLNFYEYDNALDFFRNDLNAVTLAHNVWFLFLAISGLYELRRYGGSDGKVDFGMGLLYGVSYVLIMSLMLSFSFYIYEGHNIRSFVSDHILVTSIATISWVLLIIDMVKSEFFGYSL